MNESAYLRIGHGPVRVIALHGWFGHARGWGSFQQMLDDKNFSYAFLDYRGYGAARGQRGEFTLTEIAADALALADTLQWDRFSLLGHSMGGKAMQAVAIRAPERVEAMIGVTPVPPYPVAFDSATRAAFESAATLREARRGIIDFSTGSRLSGRWLDRMTEDSIVNSDMKAFAAYFRAWANTDLSRDITRNTAQTPALMLVGEHDPSLTRALMEQTYARLYENLSIEVIQNAGHYPMDETPVDLVTRVESFLASVAGGV